MGHWQTPSSEDIVAYIRSLNFGYNKGNPEPYAHRDGLGASATEAYAHSLTGGFYGSELFDDEEWAAAIARGLKKDAKAWENAKVTMNGNVITGVQLKGDPLYGAGAEACPHAKRKGLPVGTGFVDYFPDAMLAVAELSRIGNDQHNPGKPLHWDRSKSGDESDALMRHFIERGTVDTDGIRHTAKVAWRAMALLQKEIEAENDGPL